MLDCIEIFLKYAMPLNEIYKRDFQSFLLQTLSGFNLRRCTELKLFIEGLFCIFLSRI